MNRDLLKDLEIQMGFLKASCDSYDQGNKSEAIRIAQTLRILLHNTNTNVSLLTRLKIKNLFSTALEGHIIPNETILFSLVHFTFNLNTTPNHTPDGKINYTINEKKTDCVPACIAQKNNPNLKQIPGKNKNVSINYWWDEEIIIYQEGLTMTRKKLVLTAANKDGGAHIDDTLPLEYETLKSGSPLNMTIETLDGQKIEFAFNEIHLPALRQMGHEILSSKEISHLRRTIEN